jgi:hypothetical protein
MLETEMSLMFLLVDEQLPKPFNEQIITVGFEAVILLAPVISWRPGFTPTFGSNGFLVAGCLCGY